MYRKILCLGAVLLFNGILEARADSSAVDTVNAFEKLFGVTEGKRRNHTKGFCFEAVLTPEDKAIKRYSNSALFLNESKVIGRLSHKGGNNSARDDKPAEYGMGLSISTTSGEVHNMSMNTLDFFPVSTPEAFAELMYAKTQGPAAVKAFKMKNTDLQRFKKHMSKKAQVLTPYENSTYNSLNSFFLVNAKSEKTAVRWSFVPAEPLSFVVDKKPDFFFDNMQQNLKNHSISWNMIVTIANENDVINNAAIQWSGDHKQILAAKLKVLSISSEREGKCDAINYDPLVLSKGFEASADPLLQARRNAYAISFGRRSAEKSKRGK
ncbi:catalase [Aliikangiella coralliicola]|uniref:Catalase-related peroxidase n=1 Tax=Aliikangiella coralliicola TaxID=2592383 RepID=A0A545UC21_9GAMM|nr:catalase [Aliikangiella coralliicola]TQV87021.1 catalase [Aliikangiella coralliicola]